MTDEQAFDLVGLHRKFAWLPVMVKPGKWIWWEAYEYGFQEWIAAHPGDIFPSAVRAYRSRHGDWVSAYVMTPGM